MPNQKVVEREVRGQITLSSGQWTWKIVDLVDLPSGRVDRRYVWLRDPNEDRNRMMIRLDEERPLNDSLVADLAKSPDERYCLDHTTGAEWKVIPLRNEPGRVRLGKLEGGNPIHTNLPGGATLGEVTTWELMELTSEGHGA